MDRYRDITEAVTMDGISYRNTTIYPEIPLSPKDYYVITTAGDRYDTLAQQFYQDTSLWWIIASANNSEQGSLQVDPGVQLRIPHDKIQVINLYRQANQRR
jgi:hypothetical protein